MSERLVEVKMHATGKTTYRAALSYSGAIAALFAPAPYEENYEVHATGWVDAVTRMEQILTVKCYAERCTAVVTYIDAKLLGASFRVAATRVANEALRAAWVAAHGCTP